MIIAKRRGSIGMQDLRATHQPLPIREMEHLHASTLLGTTVRAELKQGIATLQSIGDTSGQFAVRKLS